MFNILFLFPCRWVKREVIRPWRVSNIPICSPMQTKYYYPGQKEDILNSILFKLFKIDEIDMPECWRKAIRPRNSSSRQFTGSTEMFHVIWIDNFWQKIKNYRTNSKLITQEKKDAVHNENN